MVQLCKIIRLGIALFIVICTLQLLDYDVKEKSKTGIGKYECKLRDSKIYYQFSEELDFVGFFSGHYQRFVFSSEKEMYQKFYSYNITVPNYLNKYGSLDSIETILIYHYSQPYMIK